MKKTAAGRGSVGGCSAQPIAATSTAAVPIQNSRDWLDPALRKRAAKQSAAAAPGARAPRTATPRIAREANRARDATYKAFTSAISEAHSHPARWARSSLESAEAAAWSSHAQVPEATHPRPDRRCGGRDVRRLHGPRKHLLERPDPRLVRGRPDRQHVPAALLPRGAEGHPRGPADLRDAARRPYA